MNINDYINQKSRNKNQSNNQQNNNNNYQQNSYNQSNNNSSVSPDDAMDKYGNMSEEELMGELFRVGACSSGATSPEELDGFFNNIQGMLSEEQKEKMRNLITQLKMR